MNPSLSARELRRLRLPEVAPAPAGTPILDPYGEEVGVSPGCGAERVQLAGGFLNSLLVHPEIIPFEQLYRRLPEEGMFLDDVSPETPFVFELGAFKAPETFSLLLFDLRPDIYRLSGVDPGDAVPVEARRYSTILGFQPTIDQRQPANLLFQLNPVPIQTFQEAFPQPLTGQVVPPSFLNVLGVQDNSRFNIAQAESFAAATGAGAQLQPQRPVRYGARNVPFTLYLSPGQTFQVRCVVFQPIPSPIAFVEYDIAGMLMPDTWVKSMNECLKPLNYASGGPGSIGGGPR